MSHSDPAPFVPRDEKTPRIYGTLNVVFGALLLLCNLGMGAMYLAAPTLRKAVDSWQVQINNNVQKQSQARLARLKEIEAEAKTEEEKAKAKADVDAYAARPKPEVPSMSMGFSSLDDRRVWAYGVVETISGLVLNALMIVTGAGLLSLKEWGRKGAVILAGIKLARLAALVAFSMAVIIPVQVKAMEAQMGKFMGQVKVAPGGPNPVLTAMTPQGVSAMSTAGVVTNAIAACVYPILVLTMLTRPRVRAACVAAKPASRGDAW